MTGPHPIDWDRWARLKARIDAAKSTPGWAEASDSPLGVSAPPSPVDTSNRAAGVPMRSAQSGPRGAAPPVARS